MLDLSTYAEYGLIGIVLASLALTGFVIYTILKLCGNHINHNTEVMAKLCEKIDIDTMAQKETAEVLRDLKQTIINQK